MPPPQSHSTGFSQGRRWLTTLNLLVATGAALALVVMGNYLAEGHYRRFFWAEATNFKLSPLTLRLVRALTNDVKVTIFYQRKADVYTRICALLAEYQQANPSHVHVVNLDYDQSPGQARDLLARLHLDLGPGQKDFVAFEGNGQHKICNDIKLSNYDFNDALRGRPIRPTAFLGELYFTSAIYSIAHPRDQRAYFLTGHGERDPGDPAGEGQAPDATGYAKLAAILKDEMSCERKRLALSETDSIPADCSLLIIASGREPKGRLSSNELFQVQTYLTHGNARLLALLDTTEGLDPVLKYWGVVLPELRVIDCDKNFLIRDGQFLVKPAYNDTGSPVHPIVRALVREGLKIQMDTPRPITASTNLLRGPGAPTLAALAATSTNGIPWPGDRAVTTNASELPRPPYVLVAAIEQGVINGHDGTRIVVAGDADFLDDRMIDGAANHTFASQTLDWLLQRPEALVGDIGPRPIKEYELFLTQSQMTQLRWLFLAAMPGAALFLGGLVWLRRRS